MLRCLRARARGRFAGSSSCSAVGNASFERPGPWVQAQGSFKGIYRAPLKGTWQFPINWGSLQRGYGCRYMAIDLDMAVSINWGFLKRES